MKSFTLASWLPLILALLVGCQPNAVGSGPAQAGVDAGPLLAKIPEALRYKPKPEDLQAQERYIKAARLASQDPIVRQGSYGGPNQAPCLPETLAELKKIISSGPIELGYDELLDDQNSFPVKSAATIASLLGAASRSAIRSGNREEGVDLLILQVKWNLQVTGPMPGFDFMQQDAARAVLEAFQTFPLTADEKRKVLAAFPSEADLVAEEREFIKMALEDKVYALAALQAPKRDHIVAHMGVNPAFYGTAQGRRGGGPIIVPPHGTLDREETLKGLIKLAENAYQQAEAPTREGFNPQSPLLQDLVKWLPRPPLGLRTTTLKERKAVEAKIAVYVEEMNKGENTLGRQFLQTGLSMGSSRAAQIRQAFAQLRLMASQPQQKSATASRLTRPR